MTKISAPGSKDTEFSNSDIDLGILEEIKAVEASKKAIGRLNLDASRSLAEPAEVDNADPDTLVELTLEGDLRWITTVRQLEADFPEQFDRSAHGVGEDRLSLPTHLGQTTLRGGDGDGLKIVSASFFDMSVDDLIKEVMGDPAAKLGDIAGNILGPKIAEWIDNKIIEKPGLYRLNAADQKKVPLKKGESLPASEDPYLLFIHGTFSTTEGSFGNLWEHHPDIWRNIGERYQKRILALEHHTLAKSPIANALDVVEKLPVGTKLHIVSHSRGGLVGELLGCSGRVADSLFDDFDFEQFDAEGYRDLQKELIAFNNALFEKNITIERFVRVACPAAGTTLAGGKFDRWLSALMNAIGKLGLDTFGLYRFIRGFTLAVVETRTEPEHIPGLEAMMPGSPLNRILNRRDITTEADLSAIAGDIEGKGIAHRFGVWLTDLFFQGDHDLVVDTASMYGGQQRVPGKARRYFENGPDVYHFNYFKKETTARKVWDGLRREDDQSEELGFSEVLAAAEPESLRSRSRSGEPRPTVFILPGILGSELRHDGKRIWMNLRQVFRGRLERLDLHRDKPKTFEAFRMFPSYYKDLARYLAGSHNVEPFPYDWRVSMRTEAKRFAAALASELKGNSQPVRIVAHSMGGLLARLAFALDPDLWRTFQAKEGCRLIMLGTPNRGSFSIPRMLMGKEQTTGLLALLDIRHSEMDLLNFIRRFPGVLELLPADSHHDFFDQRVWTLMDDADGRGWNEPLAIDLEGARKTWRLLDNAPIDNAKMIYVAGQAAATPIDMSIDNHKVRFRATGLGDGKVPWETGIPKDMPTFYVKAEHGDLARHEKAFGGYLELMEQGTTRLLSDQQPTTRGAAVPFELPDDPTPIYPDQETLEASVLGARPRYIETKETQRQITIQLRHGDLAFSRFPVMVGHYEQDSLNGTERYLDRALKGLLRRRRERDLYPGEIDTAEVVLDDRRFPPGAIVIGLGEVGGLTFGKLKRALAHGLRRYCLTMDERLEREGRKDRSFGLSTLIIGSGVDAMGEEDALAALLDAIRDLQRKDQLGGLKEIDIIELYEHRAIAAMQALAKLHKQSRYEGQLDIKLDLKESEGGLRKIVLEKPTDWAQRIQVKEMEVADGRYRGLQYAVLTGRARIEDIAVPDTLKLADAFIKAAIGQTHFDGRSSPGRTLFELLVPRRLKLASDEDQDLVLMLDQFAAGYPWELMEDPRGDDDRPPAVRTGLIRQLHDDRFRSDVTTASQHTALVVGDPKPKHADPRFPALPGAADEARTVASMISRAGYAVTEEIQTLPASVIATFMNEPYRIMHLAGHGVFEEDLDNSETKKEREDSKPKKSCPTTGLVLGDGLFLTPGAVKQMTNVPELVFLNCCYLGRVDVSAERRTTTQFHELAANLGTQFIRNGAKVVIAAGWAVDDAAANTFAATFYQAMLSDGERFIDAVKLARQRTFMTHPYTNSWGAYQAYGDPDFTLNGKKPGNGDDTTGWYHPYEAELAFDQLAQRAQTSVRSNPTHLRQTYSALWQRTHPEWRDRSDILKAKAGAASELGLFQDAIESYDEAIVKQKSEASIRGVEQRANLRARLAVHLAKGKAQPNKTPGLEPLDMIIQSWRELERLANLQEGAQGKKQNAERLNLFGSAAKRASQLYERADKTAADLFRESDEEAAEKKYLPPADRKDFPGKQIDWLEKSAGYYWKAHVAASSKGYALSNWLTMCALVHIRDGTIADNDVQPPALAEQLRLLSDASSDAKKADLEKPSFWELAAEGDLALTEILVTAASEFKSKGKRTDAYKKRFESLVEERKQPVAKAYIVAWERGGSVLKMNSVLEQLDFIVDALAIGQSESKFERQCLTAAIKFVQDEIGEEMNAQH